MNQINEIWDRHYADRKQGIWDQARQDRFRLLLEVKMLEAELIVRREYMKGERSDAP